MRGIAWKLSRRVAILFCFAAVTVRSEEKNSASSTPNSSELRFYEEQVRPILVRRCYECHSSEADELQGELALDRRSGWERGGDRGPTIVAGKPDESLLIEAIGYLNADLQMPPDRKLPQSEIDTLEKWIAEGAPAPVDAEKSPASTSSKFDLRARRAAHWAWQPIKHFTPPEVDDGDWPRDTVDRFVLNRLEREGLSPAEAADRNTWLRRVTFDLTGLPPTRAELAEFLADKSPAAHEKVVDRLLASPAFGECWGQHWLDLVRFAETKGNEQDFEIAEAWRYRDYVIEAFNANVPFDQFVREHIAGDLLWPPRVEASSRSNQSIQGTAFWYMGEATHSPVDIRGDEADRIDNQIDVFGKAFLGLTIACARCHDHKFDAVSMADYYALCGFLESSSVRLANVADPLRCNQLAREMDELRASSAKKLYSLYTKLMELRLKDFPVALAAAMREGSSESKADTLGTELKRAEREPDHPLHVVARLAKELQVNPDQDCRVLIEQLRSKENSIAEDGGQVVVDFSHDNSSWITSGLAFGSAPVAVGDILLCSNPSQPIVAVATEQSARSGRLSHKFTGFYRTPTFTISSGKLWYRYRGKAAVFADIDSHRTVNGPLHGVVEQKLDSPDRVVWFSHNLTDYIGHRAHVEFTPQGDFELLEVRFAEAQPTTRPRESEFLLDVLYERAPRDLPSLSEATVEALILAIAAAEAGVADREKAGLANWLLAHDHLLPKAQNSDREKLEALAKEFVRRHQELESQIPEPIWSVAMLDGNGVDEHIHLRGSHKRLALAPTPRRFLTALDGEIDPGIPGSGRMQLADKLVAPDNPLTARVFVNRVWHHLFGRGIVVTVDNFGVLGEPPTHLELLDYLAAEFIADGWNTKHLIRRLVLSSTYRMSSVPNANSLARDPANHLLHAARVRRLPAEAVRDSLLAVSGNLKRDRGGPSVQAHITDFMRHFRSPKESGPLDGDCRRSIYLEVRRNSMSHFLTAFDKPLPASTVGARHVSNSPAQPLILLNDPLVHQQAEVWATALVDGTSSESKRIVAAYLTAFGREPEPRETAKINHFLEHFGNERTNRLSQISAWKQVCLTLINVKEFIYLR